MENAKLMKSLPAKVTVRSARKGDASQIATLITSIMGSEFKSDEGAYPTTDLGRLFKIYTGPADAFFVAESSKRIVGTLGVKADGGEIAILRRLFVDSACRSQGVGSQLLEKALDFCRVKGFREVIIRTSTNMRGAVRLCESFGFEENGRWTLGSVTLVRLRLRLTT